VHHEKWLLLDPVGWVAARPDPPLAGYDPIDLLGYATLRLNQLAGVSLLFASLAAVVGDGAVFSLGVWAQQAYRRRSREQGDQVRAEEERGRHPTWCALGAKAAVAPHGLLALHNCSSSFMPLLERSGRKSCHAKQGSGPGRVGEGASEPSREPSREASAGTAVCSRGPLLHAWAKQGVASVILMDSAPGPRWRNTFFHGP
jgi:hypothetical protein